MKKILSVTLITLLLFATVALSVGCGGQTDFQQAEQLMNETFDSLETAIDELFSKFEDGINPDEIATLFERLGEMGEEMEAKLDSAEERMDSFDLTEEERDRIFAIGDQRLDALEERMDEKIADLLS